MQYQMSGASLPNLMPKPVAAAPVPEPAVKTPKSRKPIWALLFVAAAGGAAYWLSHSSATDTTGGKSGPVPTRTASVTQGRLERSIRLTGTTGAQNFVSLVSPQLRGSRGGGGRDAGSKSYSSGGNVNLVISSNSGRGGTSSAGSSGGSISSSAGSAGIGQSAALQASTSRVSRPGGGASRGSSSVTTSSGGGDGLGSTSGGLVGGGDGGGGGGGGGGAPTGGGGGGMGGGGRGGGGGGAPGGGGEFGLVLLSTAKPGSIVKKGDSVAEFDRQYMLTRLDDYRTSVIQTEANVTKLRAEMEVVRKAREQEIANAKADLDKAKLDIKTTPVLSAIDAERVKLSLEEADAQYKQVLAQQKYIDIGQKSQLKTAELDLEQAKIELKRAEANADRMIMKANLGGLVVMQNMIRGSEMAQIQAGDQLAAGQSFMQIVDTSSMVINASVSQVDVDNMRIGLKARVRFDAYPELELPAHIYSIAAITKPGGMRGSFVKDVAVQLKMDTLDPRVIPDLSVSVDVIIDSEESAVIAPAGAIFGGESGKAPYVYVKTASGWDRREVQLGRANHVAIAVKSGLKAGEVVALETPPLEPPKGAKES